MRNWNPEASALANACPMVERAWLLPVATERLLTVQEGPSSVLDSDPVARRIGKPVFFEARLCCLTTDNQRELAPPAPLVGVQVPWEDCWVSTRFRGVTVPLLRKPSGVRASGRLLRVRSATA